MTTTITFRTDEELRRELEERAAAAGKTVSELIREILEGAVRRVRVEERVGHLRGRLALTRRDDEPWRRALRERNWR